MVSYQLEYSLDQLDHAAEFVISHASDKQIWDFKGEMGAGKTSLIRAICSKLGVEDDVNSPTFSIVNEYYAKGCGVIYHFDFYRLESIEEASDIGITEYFDSENRCFLEWSEKIKPFMLEMNQFTIEIETINETTRKIYLT